MLITYYLKVIKIKLCKAAWFLNAGFLKLQSFFTVQLPKRQDSSQLTTTCLLMTYVQEIDYDLKSNFLFGRISKAVHWDKLR